jgi:hypothetical protein
MMTEQERIVKDMSLCRFKSPQVIQYIVNHPMLFAKRVMSDPDDYRPVRIRYFGVFTQKYMHNKETFKKFSFISETLKSNNESYKVFNYAGYRFVDWQMALAYLKDVMRDGDKEEMDRLCSIFTKAIEMPENYIKPTRKRNKQQTFNI